jgi:hypothetical protein
MTTYANGRERVDHINYETCVRKAPTQQLPRTETRVDVARYRNPEARGDHRLCLRFNETRHPRSEPADRLAGQIRWAPNHVLLARPQEGLLISQSLFLVRIRRSVKS